MIRNVFQLPIAIALLCCAGTAAGAIGDVREIRLTASTTAAQLTLDVPGSVSPKVFTLEHPDRAVIDLSNTRLAPGVRTPPGAGIVSSLRIGKQGDRTLRIVVQLRSPATARSSWGPVTRKGRGQLIISLGDVSAAQDAAPRVIRALHAPPDSDRNVVVAVDAGHGGQDPGATGHGGTREKDVVLAIARALAGRINAEPGMHAMMTRDRDEFLTLRERIRRARVAKADMFISVHADSIANRDVSGASVYVLSERGATNEAARWLAERENAADLMGGVSLDDKDNTLASVLLDLSQSANISASMTAAQGVLTALDSVGQVRKLQVQQAGFVVLKSPDIPSMLVETAYISNPGEERRLRAAGQQVKLADAIFSGVRRYFQENPPAGTRFAQARRSTVASVMTAPSTP
jgi:N-acetylmuramoyl-L-alanine amidase